MFGIGETFKEAVGSPKRGERHFRAIDQRREALMVPLSGFAEEHGLNGAAGAQSFFDKARPLHSHEAGFRRQSAAKRHAELLEPAIVAAGEERRFARRTSVARGFTRRGHSLEVSKFRWHGAKISCKC